MLAAMQTPPSPAPC